MIYFVEDGQTGEIKIGEASNPEERKAELQVGNAHPLKLIGTIKPSKRDRSDQITEVMLQRIFRKDRIRGEWYRPSIELLSFTALVKLGVEERKLLTYLYGGSCERFDESTNETEYIIFLKAELVDLRQELEEKRRSIEAWIERFSNKIERAIRILNELHNTEETIQK